MENLFAPERPFLDWNLTGFGGIPARLFSTLSSTHRYCKEHISELETGSLIVADSQDQGRGRHDRTWISPPSKNLYFNLVYPLSGIEPKHYPQLMQVSAITIAQVLQKIGVGASVKWPNDILFEKQKLCGMVSECLTKGTEKVLIIGIGLNVNTNSSDLRGIPKPATSVSIVLGKSVNREALLQEIVQELEQSVKRIPKEGVSPWIEEWRKMDQFIGHPAHIVEGSESVEGTILDINDDGSLLFCTKSGQIITRHTGDLEI